MKFGLVSPQRRCYLVSEFPRERSGLRQAGGVGGPVQEDLFFATGGVECLGGERMEGFDAHGFEWGKYRSGEGGGGFSRGVEWMLNRDTYLTTYICRGGRRSGQRAARIC